jgi:pantoate kinase
MKASKISKAFSPSHITGFFHICDQNNDPLLRGSLGAGFSLNKGVTTTVESNKHGTQSTIIKINGKVTNQAQVSQCVIDLFSARINDTLPPLLINHRFTIPMGSGFGSSGAGALSLAYALNSHFSYPLTQEEAARIAHLAEIHCKTGLGTVIAETVGGLEIRTQAGAPGIGQIKTVPVPKHTRVLCLIFGALSTKAALNDPAVRTKINTLGENSVTCFARDPSLRAFLNCSREFAEYSGLITERVRRVMALLDAADFQCSMPMFGEGVFTLVPKEHTAEILSLFDRFKTDSVIIKSTISTEGGKVINGPRNS